MQKIGFGTWRGLQYSGDLELLSGGIRELGMDFVGNCSFWVRAPFEDWLEGGNV